MYTTEALNTAFVLLRPVIIFQDRRNRRCFGRRRWGRAGGHGGAAAAGTGQQQQRAAAEATGDRGVAAEVQRLAVMSLAHFGAYPDSARLLPPEASEVLRRTAESDSSSAKLRKDAASALAAIRG